MADVERARNALNQLLAQPRLNDTSARYYVRLALSHLQDAHKTHGEWLETYGFPVDGDED